MNEEQNIKEMIEAFEEIKKELDDKKDDIRRFKEQITEMVQNCLDCEHKKQFKEMSRNLSYERLKIHELNKEIKRLTTIHSEGWKGKDGLIITKVDSNWEIVEHRKDKLSGEIANNKHIIPELNVANIWILIKDLIGMAEKLTYRKLVPSLISRNRLPLEIEEFNGGKNRAKYYFPLYYYPIKILEKQGFIRYGGRGTIVRLK